MGKSNRDYDVILWFPRQVIIPCLFIENIQIGGE